MPSASLNALDGFSSVSRNNKTMLSKKGRKKKLNDFGFALSSNEEDPGVYSFHLIWQSMTFSFYAE